MKNGNKRTSNLLAGLAVLLAFFLLLNLAMTSCRPSGQDGPANPPQGEGTDEKPEEQPSEDEPDIPPASVESVDLSRYTIVRADMATSEVRHAIVAMNQAIFEVCGQKLSIITDYPDANTNPRSPYEIIVGHTNDPEENEIYNTVSEGSYAICKSGEKIIIVGYSDEDTVYAISRFLEMTLDYSPDHYENAKRDSMLIHFTEEKGKTMGQILDSGREIKEIEECYSDPLVPSEMFAAGPYTITDEEIVYHVTAGASYKYSAPGGSYRVQFTVENRGSNAPIVQLFCNSGVSGVEHICVAIQGNFVRMARATYERGGANFIGDPNNYTFRIEVHPSAGRVFYYVDGVFLGEMNVGDGDSPLVERASIGISGVGENINVAVKDIYIEEIDPVEARRYEAPDIEISNEGVYPKSENAPAQTIYVLDAKSVSYEDLLTATTLQGLVNRTTPQIFIDYRAYNNDPRYNDIDEEVAYLELLEAKGRTLVRTTLNDLLIQFADYYKGTIVGDCFATNYNENVATSLAGVLDAVYMTTERYDRMRKNIKKDVLFRLDNRFTSSVDAYMWLWDNYGDQFSRTVLFHTSSAAQSEGHTTRACRDYAVMSRGFTFCTTDVVTLEDYDFYMSIFAACAPNTAVIGRGGGCFPEFEMFQICGQFAKYFTYGFSTPNMSLYNSLEAGELKQKDPAEITTPEKDTVYVTFDISEGDNLSWDYHLWMYNFADVEDRAAIAKGYSFCGALYYIAPAILEYYYDQATPNDYFFMDGGGISNLSSPDDFGLLYCEDDREDIVTRMLELTEYVANKTDTSVLRALHNISDDMAKRYSEECPSIRALFSSYGNRTESIGGTSSYTKSVYMVGGIVRCRSYLTTFQGDLKPQLQQLLNQAQKSENGVVFAKVFVYANQMLDDVGVMQTFREELEAATNKKIVIVRPDVFARLYSEYAG